MDKLYVRIAIKQNEDNKQSQNVKLSIQIGLT